MSNDLKLNKGSSTADYQQQMDPTSPTKKKSGCGCFMFGCLGLIALIFLPIIGGGIYIASLDSAEWGSKVVSVLKHPEFSKGFKESLQDSPKLNEQQKAALGNLYDKFVTEYDNLSPQKQDTVNKNIFAVIKKFALNPQSFSDEPPKELTEILEIFNLQDTLSQIKGITSQKTTTTSTPTPTTPTTQPTTPTTPPTQPTTPTTTTTTTTPTTPTTDPTPPQQTFPTEYDF